MTTGATLVTGAFGLVGSAVVEHVLANGGQVIATDLDTPANHVAAEAFRHRDGFSVRWADLTDAVEVASLLDTVGPTAIIHLAAIIPPFCYRDEKLAYTVNVEATGHLVDASERMPRRPRFVQASSIAVYGPRNPRRHDDFLGPDTPTAPYDVYGHHKVEAEGRVRASGVEWVILRLGGVLSSQSSLGGVDRDLIRFESMLPADGRIQTVDVRDVARAFVAATSTDHVREIFVIGGDDSHRVVQGMIGQRTAEALGFAGGMPVGLPGDADSELGWFATDWIDTTRSQEALRYQHHSFAAMFDDMRRTAGWKRHLLRPLAPLVRVYLERLSYHHGSDARVTDPWSAVTATWGEATPGGGRAR